MVQGDAYSLKRLLGDVLEQPAAAMVSGLPLLTKPMRTRIRLINEAFGLMHRHAPFVQFTYSMTTSPIPKGLSRVAAESLPADLDEPAAGAGLGLSPRDRVVISDRRVGLTSSRRPA